MITLRQVEYKYQEGTPMETEALHKVSLEIRDGEFIGLIGHTGSGKSTLIQHLNGLVRATGGDILYNGESIYREGFSMKELRSRVGLVFQYPEHQLFEVDVFTDVCFGPKNQGLSREETETRAREALSQVGIGESYYKKSPFELSGGEKRRVAIAGVIVTRPEVLVLDEPAAGLDPLGKREIMELLHRLHREWCKTVIIVSHDMDEISENCTRAAVFSDGAVKYALPPRELFRKGEELKALGLDVPLTARLCALLKEKGVEIDCDFTAEDFVGKVLKAKGGAV